MKKLNLVPEKCCGNCMHFRQHYIKWEYGYLPLFYGHCVFPRLKNRAADQCCDRWSPREAPPPPDPPAF